MKYLFGALAGIFALCLAVTAAEKLAPDALAVVIGVIVGIAAAIPTSLVLLMVLNRREAGGYDDAPSYAPTPAPRSTYYDAPAEQVPALPDPYDAWPALPPTVRTVIREVTREEWQ